MADAEETILVRNVNPKGHILNDNDSGVDQLGYRVYAEALANLLHSASPPITVGIFGPWGIGKTFLLKHVQGLLLKYQQQEAVDGAKKNSRRGCACSCVNTTEEDGPTKGKPVNKTRRANVRRACLIHCLTIVVFLLFLAAVITLLILIFNPPNIDPSNVNVPVKNKPGSGGGPVGRIVASEVGSIAGNSTFVTTAMTTLTTEEIETRSPKVRLYLMLMLVALTGMILAVFCCCIVDTNSKCWSRFHGNIKLVLYAAFTRIPSVTATFDSDWIEAENPYMVTSFNDAYAQLRHCNPQQGNTDRISSKKVKKMPRKYIFVNYHAWQYTGSDILWAGMVTNLSQAIENEFGAVCTRMFRMLQVEQPSKSGPIKITKKDDPRAIYVQFKFPPNMPGAQTREQVLYLVKHYGVVSKYERCEQENWWHVRFGSDREADYAYRALEIDNFKVARNFKGIPKPLEQSTVPGNGHCGDNVDAGPTEGLIPGGAESPPRQITPQTPDSDQTCCEKSSSACRWFCHFRRHPKTVCCGWPFLYCFLLCVVVAVLFPVSIMILANFMEWKTIQSSRPVRVEVQILSWLPAMLGVLFVVLRFCWAMFNSQTKRIRKALAGTSGNMNSALGFMNEVKKEVSAMSQLINCVRFTHGIDYKVVITIDDLDRCPYNKVKSVLEAVSILLSDRSSPFLCLIGVDSRVAVKCVEQEMGEALLQAHLTGHEYLKKIINLPFCLPEIANNAKRKYAGGITDIANDGELERVPIIIKADKIPKGPMLGDSADCVPDDPQNGDDGGDEPEVPPEDDSEPSTTSTDGPPVETPRDDVDAYEDPSRDKDKFSKFLFQCLKILQGDDGRLIRQHMTGNPRNIKRIFNVISLSTHLMMSIDEREKRMKCVEWLTSSAVSRTYSVSERRPSIMNANLQPRLLELSPNAQDAADLVKWIVAADQWPYRISYILQVVEDSDQRRRAGLEDTPIKDDSTLSYIYENIVEPEIAEDPDSAAMLTLDTDPALLRSFLRACPTLTRKRISSLFPVTLNLDQSLRNGIARQRSRPKAPPEETTTAQVQTNKSISVPSDSEKIALLNKTENST